MTASPSTSPLLQTKLYIPRSRPGLVSRARLIERLNQAIEGKLTVVCAPAGFGKTTLLGQWLASDRAAAWVSLDPSDNEPTLFWAYLIAALQTVHAEIGQTTLSLLRSPQPLPVETLLGPLLNEVAALAQRSVLVLDDYHLIAAQPIHEAIGFLLDHLPPQLHLVIASRADPSLPLSRLRARGQLAELRAADLHLGFCDLLCDQNDIEAATHHLRQGEELGKHAPLRQTPYRLARARARLRQVHGDLDRALDLLDEAERLYIRGVVPEVRPVTALKARWWVAQGRVAEARDWVHQQGLSVDDHLEYMREFEHITLARVLVAGSDRSSALQARRFLERLLQAAEQGGRTGSAIEILVLQARAHQMGGDMRPGRAMLQRAVTLAETEGYVRIFVDEGAPMHALLRHAVRTGGAASYAQRLLSAFDIRVHPESASAGPVVTGLAEPLTARELEILRLVAEGLRNQEIADRLVISLATVKRHIANTYGKLGVDHRTEAVARLTS